MARNYITGNGPIAKLAHLLSRSPIESRLRRLAKEQSTIQTLERLYAELGDRIWGPLRIGPRARP
jgi:hypothetical protein